MGSRAPHGPDLSSRQGRKAGHLGVMLPLCGVGMNCLGLPRDAEGSWSPLNSFPGNYMICTETSLPRSACGVG